MKNSLKLFLIVLLAVFSSCSPDDNLSSLPSGNDGTVCYKMRYYGSFEDYNSLNRSTSIAQEWVNGDKLYIKFTVGSSTVSGTATYNGNEWVVNAGAGLYNTDGVHPCSVYYFKDATSHSSSSVTLSATSAVYNDGVANYSVDGDEIYLYATLSPVSGRVRFITANATSVPVSGLRYNSQFNVSNHTLTTSADGFTLQTAWNNVEYSTPYVYGTFATSDRKLTVSGYQKTFPAAMLAVGESGYLTVPTAVGDGWELPPIQTYPSWTSTNTTSSSTSSHTYNFTNLTAGSVLTFSWSVSSESGYDKLIVTIDGSQVLDKSGVYSGTYTHTFTTAGNHTMVTKYTKDGSQSHGDDRATITNVQVQIAGGSSSGSSNINGHEAVDLGLSVKWATCNVGATTPEGYGDYFAWGETVEKSNYDWSTYKYCNGSNTTLTKYCTSSSYGTVDNKTTLELTDDAARVNWGGSWRMPTSAEQQELLDNCTWTWTTQSGVNGYRVTGSNGNSIFLPSAGSCHGTSVNSIGTYGRYWSSSLNSVSNYYACFLYFNSSSKGWNNTPERSNGYTVRPVTE